MDNICLSSSHPHTFHRLFQHSTQPQLEQLQSVITHFFSLKDNISLNSQILCSFNDSYSTILNHINTLFNDTYSLLGTYINIYMTTTNLNFISIIQSIHKILLQSVKYISYAIRIIAFYFNILLNLYYKTFIEKLKEHKSKIEQNIKRYIKEITEELRKACRTIVRLNQNIKQIKTQIENFDKNYKNIFHISGYNSVKSIIQRGKPFTTSEISEIYDIFRTLVDYRNALRIFKTQTKSLTGILSKLDFYSNNISKISNDNSGELSDCRNDLITSKKRKDIFSQFQELIDLFFKLFSEKEKDYKEELRDYTPTVHHISETFQSLKANLDKFDEYVKKAKLQEIGDHITTMKSKLNKVKSRVKPEFIHHIHNLANFAIDYNKIQKKIKKIQNFSNRFFEKYKIANNAIELYNLLDSGTSMLKGVKFDRFNIDELITNSNEIKNKITSFETINLSDNINTQNIPSEISQTQQQYKDDIFTYKSLISYLLDEISVLIYIYYLMEIITLYSNKIRDMPTKITRIDDIDTALSKLPEIVKDLVIVYRVNNISMNILIVFNFISFARLYINKYIYNFIMINYFTEILIFSIYCYYIILSLLKFLQEVLKDIKSKIPNLLPESREIKVLQAFTSSTNAYLQSIQCDIESLKSISDNLNVNNLKYNIMKIRTTIDKISEETNQVKNNIKFIIKGVIKLYIINIKIIHIKTYINIIIKGIISYVDHIYIYYLMMNLSIAKRYTKNEKDWILLINFNSIFELKKNLVKILNLNQHDESVFKTIIQNFMSQLVSVTNSINELTKSNETYIREIDKSVIEVECAIEGVVRNFIRCSLLSSINNITVSVINDNNINSNGKVNKDNNNKIVFNL